MKIEVNKIYVYEREACDCCEGWWEERIQVVIDDEVVYSSPCAEEVLQWLSDNTAILDYSEEEFPSDD